MIPIKLPKEHKNELISRLQSYYEAERGETIGELGAEQLLDFVMKEMGPFIYNKAIQDARSFMNEKAAQIEEELYAMELSTKNR